ncbi:MAG TPA: HTH domain-containing protein [Jatrophihabitans sp.]|nr:HTH domain-containing protein [Jatrophihabitans sp.]
MEISDQHRAPAGAGLDAAELRTRDAVARLVQQSGAQSAATLAERLALSPAAVRRHLDALVAEGTLAEAAPRPIGRRPRGRGRPARSYVLTDAGRAKFGHAYDDLASTALRYLRQSGGEQALVDFADHRAAGLTGTIRARLADQPLTMPEKAELVAEVLTDEGYVANTAPAGHGTQLCQHHCPVAHVAAEFPQLCEAETRALAEALGTNVQRLATIAHGDGVCTTHIPDTVTGVARSGTQSSPPGRSKAWTKAPTSSTGGRQ